MKFEIAKSIPIPEDDGYPMEFYEFGKSLYLMCSKAVLVIVEK